MKKNYSFIAVILTAILLVSCGGGEKKYSYESVPNDPLNARIYTLDNGLKVYMSVYKDAPRIQTFIAVRVGGKNDPAETTGLAHYFEHLMFKGTKQFGTKDYEAEKPMLDKIEELFEVYRKTTDEAERKAIYKQIDSVSYEASKLSIPNEYDKLMSAIGAQGTNAWTSYDETVYVEDIPSNQVENWAKIQSDRFTNATIRGFHTELETVYEEKNMSLTQDGNKVYEKILSTLFPNHPYGTQTVLGTQEHLKNPSIINIKNYFKTYYVPNNMAVCMSGDFDPDVTIKIIDQYFGSIPKGNVPEFKYEETKPITAPIVEEVIGNDAENITLAWHAPGVRNKDYELLQMASYMLNNGQAGLIDLNITQKQRTLNAYAGAYGMADYSAFVMGGRPKGGQTLDEVRDILLEQMDLLKKGEFPEWLLEATINNLKLNMIYRLQNNRARANMFVDAFINGIDWKDEVAALDRMSKITKQQVVDLANKYFADNNYTVIYKRQGKDPNEQKMPKPEITPIETNRDAASIFLVDIQNTKVPEIEPVFLDYTKDLQKLSAKQNIEVLYKQNTDNVLFDLSYVFDMGTNNDKALGMAFSYLNYLGTSKYTPDEIKSEFYKMACSFDVWSGTDRVYVSLSGLNENMEKALGLLEELLNDPQVNHDAFKNLVLDIQKERTDAKLNQRRIFSMLNNYTIWGKKSPATNILSTSELNSLKAEQLIDRIKDLHGYQHFIMYYGPKSQDELKVLIDQVHNVSAELKTIPEPVKFEEQMTKDNKVYFAHYDANQIYFAMISKKGEKFDQSIEPIRTMYNEYFGGGMNAIVFQEMREARGLAYSANANLGRPSRLTETYTMSTFIATQNDKLHDAVTAFDDIINNMPESEKAFALAKESIMTRVRTQRILRSQIIWNYINARDMGLNYDTRKDIFEKVPSMTLADVKKFQEEWVKGRTYTYCILGNKMDMTDDKLKEYGTVHRLTLEEIFGY
ncbi:MAG: insulinase family protein [Prevotellaceae bacterium]|jgi:predicted Zn-dependent peptidase|nr:insulinase family protein [Prevotellaceae bacterium]